MTSQYEDRYWISSDGLKLYYRDYAGSDGNEAGLPILCMHGLTRNSRDFEDLAEHLASDYRVIVPEMRGRGLSEYASDSDSYNPGVYVADVELLLEEQGIDHFIAIGTSMGGLMTMLMAAAKPGRIAGVVMNDIGPVIDPAGIARIGGYVGQQRTFPTWVHAAKAIASVHQSSFPEYDLDQWLRMAKRSMVVGQNGRISFDYDMAIAEPFSKPGNAAPPDLWSAFDALNDVPMVLVRGGLSDLISPETVEQMGRRNSAMTTVTVPNVGHAPTLDEPEARAAIDSLLAKLA